jgi:hypothetical protein
MVITEVVFSLTEWMLKILVVWGVAYIFGFGNNGIETYTKIQKAEKLYNANYYEQ